MTFHTTHDDALLEKAVKELLIAYDVTSEQWRDHSRTDFAKDHLDELTRDALAGAKALRQMQTLIEEAVHQCS